MVENAPRTLGLVSRVLKMASTRTRQLAYKTLVRPILFRVWMPSVHCATRPGSQHQAALILTRCVKGRGGFLTLPRHDTILVHGASKLRSRFKRPSNLGLKAC